MGSCPEGWILYSGFCYMINTSRMTTWIVAKDSCEAVGAQLLKIGSDEEQHFLKSTIYQTGEEVGTDKSIWIGFSDMEIDGKFRWTDGSQVQVGNGYTNFADLQPENSPGQPDCGSFYMGNPNLYWETYNCFKEQGFICKIQAGQELKDTSHTEYKGCKPGWVAFKDPATSQIHCYLFDHDEELPWTQAEEKCQSFGEDIHLASIHSVWAVFSTVSFNMKSFEYCKSRSTKLMYRYKTNAKYRKITSKQPFTQPRSSPLSKPRSTIRFGLVGSDNRAALDLRGTMPPHLIRLSGLKTIRQRKKDSDVWQCKLMQDCDHMIFRY